MKKSFAVGLMLLWGAGVADAAPSDTIVGDAAQGKEKSATCAACHGADGNSMLEIYPKLAGQHASYLVAQLEALKLGQDSMGKEGRYDPVMSAQAANLSDQDRADLAAYYAAQPIKLGETPADVVSRAEALFRGGDAERGIPACIACHGPRGVGHSLAKFPQISGQHPAYIKAQLEKFRSGQRANDPNGMMRDTAAKLSDQDIEILSQYLAGLH